MKNSVVCCLLTCLLLSVPSAELFAQHDLGLYNLQPVPQRILQNPAFIPDQKTYIGIPLLSGVQSAYALPFTYNDVIEKDSYDSITLKVESFLGKLGDNEEIRFCSNLDMFSAGTHVSNGRFYLGFSIRERLSQQSTIPMNLGTLLWYGNANPQIFGKEVSIAPTINLTVYDEWAASFSGYALQGKISWGVRLKYLSGRINATTARSDLYFHTDTGSYEVSVRSDIELRTSGIEDIESYLDKPVSSLVFPGNNGAGLDLGVNYMVNDRIGISASITDIGFINWKSNTMTLVSHNPGEVFEFKGFNLEDFMELLGDPESFGDKLYDSVLNLVDIDTVYDTKYTSRLPVRYNLGGSYLLKDRHRFNLLLNGISWNNSFQPALSVSYTYKLPNLLSLMASYNIFNRQYTNFGGGVAITGGPIQMYLVSDNIPGLILYRGTNNSSIQFGINILINRESKPGGDPSPQQEVQPATPE